jgi:hypothetical protein
MAIDLALVVFMIGAGLIIGLGIGSIVLASRG